MSEQIALVTVEGSFSVQPDALTLPVVYGPVELWENEGEVRFLATVTREPPADYSALIRRMELATEAAVAAATGASGVARADLRTYAINGTPALTVGVGAFSYVVVSAGPDAQVRGSAAADAVLLSADERLAELWEVFLLGVRAVSSAASPVVGLWAFSTILEEPSPGSLKGARALADRLRAGGHPIPGNPERHPQAVRAAALHPSPKASLPTHDEVAWFRATAEAYLRDRAGQGLRQPSQRRRGDLA